MYLSNPKGGSSSTKSQPEPYAQQAKHFTELRLLNREVEVLMQALDRWVCCTMCVLRMYDVQLYTAICTLSVLRLYAMKVFGAIYAIHAYIIISDIMKLTLNTIVDGCFYHIIIIIISLIIIITI